MLAAAGCQHTTHASRASAAEGKSAADRHFDGAPSVPLPTAPSARSDPAPPPPAPTSDRFALVELFTSEGCSSCPPADRLLGELAGEARASGRSVLTLSFHVDYWNDLGWSDPFSTPIASARQRSYARVLSGGVYTPEMVVDGRDAFLGSDADRARATVAGALERARDVHLTVRASRTSACDRVHVGYEVSPPTPRSVVHIALVQDSGEARVSRGENAGRTLRHQSVVRAFWTSTCDAAVGGNATLQVPRTVGAGPLGIVAYVQDAASLEISAATRAAL